MAPAPLHSTANGATEPGRADTATARLFFALWPDEATRFALLAHQARWRWSRASRRTRGERLHATLLFLGDAIDRERIAELVSLCPRWPRPVELVLDAAQVWPRGIAVLGASQVPEPLIEAHDALRAACGAPARPWRAHVTLARQAEGALPPQAFAPIAWRVDRAVLVESDLRPPGHYRVLGER